MAQTIRRGDSYLSPTWAVVLAGAAVDLSEGGPWTVRAQARHRGVTVIDFGSVGDILRGTAVVRVGSATITTGTVRLYLPPAATAALEVTAPLRFDVEIEHPTAGPRGDLFRATLVSDVFVIADDVTRAS